MSLSPFNPESFRSIYRKHNGRNIDDLFHIHDSNPMNYQNAPENTNSDKEIPTKIEILRSGGSESIINEYSYIRQRDLIFVLSMSIFSKFSKYSRFFSSFSLRDFLDEIKKKFKVNQELLDKGEQPQEEYKKLTFEKAHATLEKIYSYKINRKGEKLNEFGRVDDKNIEIDKDYDIHHIMLDAQIVCDIFTFWGNVPGEDLKELDLYPEYKGPDLAKTSLITGGGQNYGLKTSYDKYQYNNDYKKRSQKTIVTTSFLDMDGMETRNCIDGVAYENGKVTCYFEQKYDTLKNGKKCKVGVDIEFVCSKRYFHKPHYSYQDGKYVRVPYESIKDHMDDDGNVIEDEKVYYTKPEFIKKYGKRMNEFDERPGQRIGMIKEMDKTKLYLTFEKDFDAYKTSDTVKLNISKSK
jgi:hypothetical protein